MAEAVLIPSCPHVEQTVRFLILEFSFAGKTMLSETSTLLPCSTGPCSRKSHFIHTSRRLDQHVYLWEGSGGPMGRDSLRESFGRLSARASGSSFFLGSRQQARIRTALVKVDRPCRSGDTLAEFRRGRAPGGTLSSSGMGAPFF